MSLRCVKSHDFRNFPCCAYIDGSTGSIAASTSAYAANTQGAAFSIIPNGMLAALPGNQLSFPDITINGTNDAFTVNEAGRYKISYAINTVTALPSGSWPLISGAPNAASAVLPNTPPSLFAGDILADLKE
nr:hypothetical protein [uncultured Oscillibacter sp.]